jgi:molybdate transport system ATP-binding protein
MSGSTPTSPFLATLRRTFSAFDLNVALQPPLGITMLFGASGSGKSTILNCIAGLIIPDSGHIRLGDQVLYDSANHVRIPTEQRRIGYVFQNLALFPHLNVEKNIAYGLRGSDSAARISEILEAFRIVPLRFRKPRDISGGEQQRVALARALVTKPRALLLDEPLSALDPATKSHIMDDLRSWTETHQIPVLYVTHSREEVFSMGKYVIALDNGRVVFAGTPREVFSGHRHEAIAEWGGTENVFSGTIQALHETQGTMTFRTGSTDLEVPLGRRKVNDWVRVGVSASDILLASQEPRGLSARNVISGTIQSIEQRDATMIVKVDCRGTTFEAHLTPGAIDSLRLQKGSAVWVVIKTHSCFLIER